MRVSVWVRDESAHRSIEANAKNGQTSHGVDVVRCQWTQITHWALVQYDHFFVRLHFFQWRQD